MNEDQEWVRQTMEGDKQSFAHLVNKYGSKIFTLLISMGNSRTDAQDMAQEVFIKAYRRLRSYDPSRSFPSWLYRIAVNHCRDEWRKRGKEARTDLEETSLIDTCSPEAALLRKENTETVRNMIEVMPDPYRTALLLRYAYDLSYQEISEVLGIPVSNVHVHVHRAKKKLREQLVRKGDLHELLSV